MLRPLAFLSVLALAVACAGPTGEPGPDLTRWPTTITLLSGGDQTVVAGDTLAQPIRVRLTDSLGAPVARWDVGVEWDSLAASPEQFSSSRTDATGTATVTSKHYLRAGRIEGSIRVDFPYPGRPTMTLAFAENVVAGPPASVSFVSHAETERYTGQVTDGPTVLVQDRLGNLVPSAPVHFTASATSSVSDTLVLTDSLGQATPGKWTHGIAIRTDSVTATSGTGRAVATEVVVSDPPARVVIDNGDNQQVPVGTVFTGSIQLIVQDAAGRYVPRDYPVVWSDDASGEVICIGTPNFNPTHCSWDVGPQTGTRYLKATAGAAVARVAVTILAAPAKFEILDDPAGGNAFAPGTRLDSIRLRLTLPDGSPAAGYTVNETPGGSLVTDSNGIVTATWTLPTEVTLDTLSARFVVSAFPALQRSVFALMRGQVLFADLSAGKAHTCGTSKIPGSVTPPVICWGRNAEGEVGDGTTIERTAPTPTAIAWSSILTGYAGASASGTADNCATFFGPPDVHGMQTDLYCWGANDFGQAGSAPSTSAPPHVVPDVGVERAANGRTHTCAVGLTAFSGRLVCWGDNSSGQLGDGTTTTRTAPMPVQGLPSLTSGPQVTAVNAGDGFTCAVAGSVAYCWGLNADGQLGVGTTANSALPAMVAGLSAGVQGSVAVGDAHACVLDPTGVAYCWGRNDAGQLGDGSTTSRNTPTRVATTLTFASIAAGGSHTCALTPSGAAFCWGANASGELGTGVVSAQEVTPQPVTGGLAFYSLTVGASHTCAAARNDNYAYCWGLNSDGQLGDGTHTSRARPTQVANLGGRQ